VIAFGLGDRSLSGLEEVDIALFTLDADVEESECGC